MPSYISIRQARVVTLANLTFLSIFLSKFQGQIRDYNLTFCACCMMMLVPRENRPPLYFVVDESGCRVASSKHTKLIILCTLDPNNNNLFLRGFLKVVVKRRNSSIIIFIVKEPEISIISNQTVKQTPFLLWEQHLPSSMM